MPVSLYGKTKLMAENYVKKKYDKKFDFDYLVAKKISKLKCKQILLRSRAV